MLCMLCLNIPLEISSGDDALRALLVDLLFFSLLEIFGLRICVLTHDLGLTLALGIPLFRANLVLAFFFEHLVNDPSEVSS